MNDNEDKKNILVISIPTSKTNKQRNFVINSTCNDSRFAQIIKNCENIFVRCTQTIFRMLSIRQELWEIIN